MFACLIPVPASLVSSLRHNQTSIVSWCETILPTHSPPGSTSSHPPSTCLFPHAATWPVGTRPHRPHPIRSSPHYMCLAVLVITAAYILLSRLSIWMVTICYNVALTYMCSCAILHIQ